MNSAKGSRVPDGDEEVEGARRAEREMIERRKAAAARWPELLSEIRQVPGFEDFAMPPPMSKLRTAAGEGTVVAITVTEHGCGALLLNTDQADYLELPALTAQAAFDHANVFVRALRPATGSSADVAGMTEVLEWLWDAVTGPVLERLGHTGTPVDPPWPRVWWIPTGALSVLPLHAAGHHQDPPGHRRSVLDRVVSSYTPSVRALGDARQARTGGGTSVLSVGINSTADAAHTDLRMAEPEAVRVLRQLGAAEGALLGAEATHDEVVRRLAVASWVHLSCHGFVDNADPSQSFLALYDRSLKVHELFSMRLEDPYLAYLSACSTGLGSLRLLDESIHLAAAFQLAGFPHVIGTLWPIPDRVSAELAESFYAAVGADSSKRTEPALALHATIHTFRARYLDHPQVWASHVHFGP